MIVKQSSYRAAKAHAERAGETEEFRRAVNAYADRLRAEGEMVPMVDARGRIVAWAAALDDAWYAVDADAGRIEAGPTETKADCLTDVGAAESSKVAPGVYEAVGLLIGRRRDLRALLPDLGV